MTKRNLNKEEKELTERNLKRSEKEIKELKEGLEYNMDLIKKQEYLREFDDKWREYLRNQKDEEDKKILKVMNEKIEELEFLIRETKKQLTEGIEIKTPSSVK